MHKKSERLSGEEHRSEWYIILLVWAAGLGAAAQFGKVAIALGEFRAVYQVSEVSLGFLISCVGIVGLVFGVLGGILISNFGIKRAFIWGMFIAAALSALQSIMLPFPLLLATRILEGGSHLSIVVAGPILMARHSSDRARSSVMTLWSSFFGLSYMFVALIAPNIVARGGLSWLLLSHAIYMFAIAFLLLLALPASKPPKNKTLQPVGFSFDELIKLQLSIYRSPWLSAAAFGFVFYTALYIALLTYLPTFVDKVYQGELSATLPLASIATSLTLGVVLLRFVHPVRAVMIGYFLTLLAVIPLYFTFGDDRVFILACLLLLGAIGLVPGASFAALAALNRTDQDRAYATGAIAQLGNLGTTTGPPMLAAIVPLAGVSGTVSFVMALSLSGILVHHWLARRRNAVLARID